MSKKRTSVSGTSKASAGPSRGPMDLGLLEQMVKLMAANDLNTVDVRDGDKRVILKRGAAFAAPPQAMYSSTAAVNPSAPPASPPPAGVPDDSAGLVPIKSPMVGTFYSSATPEAKAFVSVGTAVTEDTDVCIIEAMKVFNNIKSETRGTVAKVMVTNGQTVEFGQTLFLVKP